MNKLRQWTVDPPRVSDGFLALLLILVVLPATVGGSTAPGVLGSGPGVDGGGWLLFLGLHVPLVWRRSSPTIVFWSIAALVGLCVAVGITGVFLISAPLFAVYAVARYRRSVQLWPSIVLMVAVLVVAWLTSDTDWRTFIGIGAVLAAVCLLGLFRRARETATAERARHRQLEQEARARIAVVDERSRIAREVHDIVAHNLAVMVALADGASATVEADPAQAEELMRQSSTTGREALSEMRRLVGLLREGNSAAPQPGLDDLDRLVAQVREAGLKVEVEDALEHRGALSAGSALTIYRIVQEALTNTLKHAGPNATAKVHLTRTTGGIEIEVTDTGTGCASATGGHGLLGIVERVGAYGGEVEAGAVPGGGWRVHARLPLQGGEVAS